MPSLQQTSFKDWPSPDIARSLTGPDILQKHSINSLLLEHNEIINRVLPSPIEENVSFSELLGSSQSSQSTSTSSLLGNGGHHSHHHQHKYGSPAGTGPDSGSSMLSSTGSGPNSASSPSVLSTSTNPFCFSGLSMSSSSLNSPELVGAGGGGGSGGHSAGGGGQSPTYYGNGAGLHKSSFDDFRFDSDLGGLSSNGNNTNSNGTSNLTSETLKLLQRNMATSYDCSPLPTSPSSSSSTTAAALCARYFRGSQQQPTISDLNHNGYEPTSSSSLFSTSSTTNQSSSLSRSNSPPDNDASLLANFDSTNILDMISYLTISQQQQQQQNGHYNSSNGGGSNGSSHYGQTQQSPSSSASSSLNSFYQQGGGGSSYGANGNCSGGGVVGQGSSNGGGGGGCGFSSNDYERLQNLQALNTLRLLQQSQYQLQQQYQQFNQLMPSYGGSQLKSWPSHNSPPSSSGSSNGGGGGGSGNDINLDRIARFHRSSAAHYDATCTWSGVLPPRSHRLVTYSSKIFLGGMPWDISEQSLVQIFKPFGSIKVEWPGKEQQATQPKGYVYIIFESDKQVKALLQACTYSDANGYGGSSSRGGNNNNNNSGMMASGNGSCNDDMQLVPLSPGQQALVNKQHQSVSMAGARINFKISSKRIKSKDVEVIPWNIADSNYVKSTSQKLDPTKTVFVGALHGQLTAEGLAKIMNDLFDGVVYVGIDTDKYKYPLGSARVTFNNSRSYMKAVVAAFIEIKTAKFTKKLQVDPYLEDSLCSMCGVQHGPYFCREIVCFRYFCRSCWQFQHNRDASLQNHKPLTRNSKSTTIVGVGPQQQQPQQQSPPASIDSSGLHRRQQQMLYHHHMSQSQQQQQQSPPTSDVHRRLYNVGHLQDLSSSSSLSLPQSPSPSCTTSSSSGSSADSSPVNCHGPANLHQQLQQQFGGGL